MEPQPGNTPGRLRRWKYVAVRYYISNILAWTWKNVGAICSKITLLRVRPGACTSWIRQQGALVKIIIDTVGLIFTCVGVWAAVSAVTGAKTANKLAYWTSTKDFMEFCESHNTTSCMATQNKSLPPPPGFSFLRWRSLTLDLWGSYSTSDNKQSMHFDVTSILPIALAAVFLYFVTSIGLQRRTNRQFTVAARRAFRRLLRTRFWPGNHPTSLPLARPTIELPENSNFVAQEVSQRHRKPTVRRRREARLDRFSRYRTIDGNRAVDDDTSSDELYAHGEDTRRSRLRLRRRTKRVVNDENVVRRMN